MRFPAHPDHVYVISTLIRGSWRRSGCSHPHHMYLVEVIPPFAEPEKPLPAGNPDLVVTDAANPGIAQRRSFIWQQDPFRPAHHAKAPGIRQQQSKRHGGILITAGTPLGPPKIFNRLFPPAGLPSASLKHDPVKGTGKSLVREPSAPIRTGTRRDRIPGGRFGFDQEDGIADP